MKKNNNKGFMLIETLLVATFVLGVLTYLFIQFSALKLNYDDNFRYNTVPELYGAKNVHQYISKYNGYTALINSINSTALGYTEFTCASISGTTCKDLLDSIKVKHIYFVKDSIFKDKINPDLTIFSSNDELYRFTKRINLNKKENINDDEYNRSYHLIIEYTDNKYATMAITL